MKRSILPIIFITVSMAVFGQQEKTGELKTHKEKVQDLVNRVMIIETFGDPLKASEPGYFIATFAKDTAKDSYNTQLAVGVNMMPQNWIDKRTQELNVVGEWHRNTLIPKKQDNVQYGLNYYIILNENNFPDKGWFALPSQLGINYSRDDVKKTEAVLGKLYFTPLVAKSEKWYGFLAPEFIHPGKKDFDSEKFFKLLRYQYTVSVGIEHLNNYRSADDLNEGKLTMGYVSLNANVYPFGGYLNNMIRLYYNYTGRKDFSNSMGAEQYRVMRKYGIGVSHKFKKSANRQPEISINYEVVSGQDVTKAFEEQKYNQLVLKAKFTLPGVD